ncbi:MAG: hypothetical protein R3F34_03080 [Planctomycetota bacterium]
MTDDPHQPKDVYLQLRDAVLALTAEQVGIEPAPRVLAALLEIGQPIGVATLVVVAEGTTSLYFSTGGGVLGGGSDAGVAEASRGFLAAIDDALDELPATGDQPVPPAGCVRFVAVLDDGTTRGSAVPGGDLENEGHPLLSVWFAGHRVLAGLQELDEVKAAERGHREEESERTGGTP